MPITVEPRVKLNGCTRFWVLADGIECGMFYTAANARRFISRELRPALRGAAIANTLKGR